MQLCRAGRMRGDGWVHRVTLALSGITLVLFVVYQFVSYQFVSE